MNADNTITLADFRDFNLGTSLPDNTVIIDLHVIFDVFRYDNKTPCQTLWMKYQHDPFGPYLDFPLYAILVIRETQL